MTRRCGGRSAFLREHHPLRHSEAVLLVHHRQPERR
jgi:hypothetical protein